MTELVEYKLYLPDKKKIKFQVSLNKLSDKSRSFNRKSAPDWTLLEKNKCSHCPLTSEQSKFCPLATRLIPFVEELSHLSSLEKIKVEVTQYQQTRYMIAPVQEILGSLLGLFIATSDCPHTRFLRPMAFFHLPLADADETVYRVLAMYRMAQYYKKEKTGKAYANFDNLDQLYHNVTEVNHKLSLRIRVALEGHASMQDGTLNAVSTLDALSQFVPASMDDAIEDLSHIFDGYWDFLDT